MTVTASSTYQWGSGLVQLQSEVPLQAVVNILEQCHARTSQSPSDNRPWTASLALDSSLLVQVNRWLVQHGKSVLALT